MIQYLPLLLISVPIVLIAIAMIRHFAQQRKSAKAWDNWQEQNPEEFLADDEWVFVKYRDAILPMTRFEKLDRWDNMTGQEKRKAYLLMQKQWDKGRIKKMKTEDGNVMYVKTQKGSQYIIDRYNKLSKTHQRKFGKPLKIKQQNATSGTAVRKQTAFSRKH